MSAIGAQEAGRVASGGADGGSMRGWVPYVAAVGAVGLGLFALGAIVKHHRTAASLMPTATKSVVTPTMTSADRSQGSASGAAQGSSSQSGAPSQARQKPPLIKDYKTVRAVLQSREMSPAPQRLSYPGNREEIKSLYRFVSLMLLYNDRDHTRLRKAYPRLNSRKDVEVEYEQFIQRAIDQLLDKVENQDSFDLMADVAVRLPWIVVAHLGGVPEEDIPQAAALIRVMGNFVGTPFSKELMEKAAEALVKLREMITRWGEGYKSEPSDKLFAKWLNDSLFESSEEYESNVVMLLFAATHNLENVLGHMIRLLLQHPDQLAMVRERPTLIENAIEEVLRFCPAIRTVPRTAKEDVVLNGVQIPKGQTVILSVFDANRDPQVFDDPARFDITRDVEESAKHVTFGFGPHLCVGNAIARLQLRLLTETILVRRMPKARLVDESHVPDWEHTYSTLHSLMMYTGRSD